MGPVVEKTGELESEMKCRLNKGCKVLGSLMSVMSCRTLGLEAKKGLYEILVV